MKSLPDTAQPRRGFQIVWDLMGFTPALAKLDFTLILQATIEQKSRLTVARSAKPTDAFYAAMKDDMDNEIAFLSALIFDKWVSSMHTIKTQNVHWVSFDPQSNRQTYSRELDQVEAHILNERYNLEHPRLGYYCSDLRLLIRAFLLCAEPTDMVVLDCTEVFEGQQNDSASEFQSYPITASPFGGAIPDARTYGHDGNQHKRLGMFH